MALNVNMDYSSPNPNYSSYTFDAMSRIGLDSCNLDQNTIQNIASCNYMVQNYYSSDCTMKNPINLATSQPGIMYNGGYGSGAGGCNINDSSKLLIGTIQTHPKCNINLFHRPFATVPYLGRGSVNPVMEAQILQGEQSVKKNSVLNSGEKISYKYYQTPLLPAVSNKINDPSYKIESMASDGWVRGGIPSRELSRDTQTTTN